MNADVNDSNTNTNTKTNIACMATIVPCIFISMLLLVFLIIQY